MRVVVTGGAGYIGSVLTGRLLDRGHDAVVLDSLLHSQTDVAASLARRGARLVTGDVRDEATVRTALEGSNAVVHLAAIVGDPACAQQPDEARSVNIDGSRGVVGAARRFGLERVVFASTCSNYGRMADPSVLVDETAELRPLSLYAETKVSVEQELLASEPSSLIRTCLRFATVYGLSPRMRFDLTVNEFTRDLWARRPLEVFGERFWRPYIHVGDAATAVVTVLESPASVVDGRVFNAGSSAENYRKCDLVDIIKARLGRGNVSFVHRDEDPRDYKVSFERIRRELGFAPARTVRDGVDELIVALDGDAIPQPFAARYSNSAA